MAFRDLQERDGSKQGSLSRPNPRDGFPFAKSSYDATLNVNSSIITVPSTGEITRMQVAMLPSSNSCTVSGKKLTVEGLTDTALLFSSSVTR